MSKAKQKTGVKVGHLNKQVILRDKTTGELFDYGDAEIRTEERNRNKGFFMLWTAGLKSEIFELRFVIWMISAMRGNYIHISDEQLAKKFECSRQRIGRIKRQLKKDGIIRYKPGVIFLNPAYIWKGSAYAREQAEAEYYRFEEDEI